MAHRARITINSLQDGTPSTYNYTLFTEWHTEHVLLYTVNRMAHQARIIINCQQDGTPSAITIHCLQDGTPSTYNYTLFTEWHTEHVLL